MRRLKVPRSKIKNILNGKTAFHLVCFSMKCLGTYPIPDNASCIKSTLYRLLWGFYIVNQVLLLFPTMHTFINSSENIMIACFSWMESIAMVEAVFILIHFKLQQPRVRILLSTAKNLFNSSESLVSLHTSNLYVTAFMLMFSIYAVIIYMYLDRNELTELNVIMTARYTFLLKSATLKTILYIHQALALMHITVVFTTDGLIVLLVYVCTVKLTMLKLNMREEKSYDDFKKCIIEHQEILLLINETNEVAKIIAMKDVMIYMAYSISTGLQLLKIQSLTSEVLFHFLVLCVISLRFFICAESAENLMTAANDLINEAYFTNWYKKTTQYIHSTSIVILRCQKLPRIYISGFMSAIGRSYVAMVLYSTYSYFTTIRLMINK